MMTLIASIARSGRRTGAVAAALLVAGALAAACGTAHVSPVPGGAGASGKASGGTGSGGTASGGTGSGGTASSGPTSGTTGPATPVPTVSGGSVPAGETACVGWPSSAPTGRVPATFVAVSVERCVNGATAIPGKGLWSTATLERADGGLTGLVSALREPPGTHTPGTVCPALAEIPQQIVLFSDTGQQLIPRLPVTGCGLTESGVTVALDALHWHTVSVRLIDQISGGTTHPVVTATPRSIQTVGAAGPG